MFYSRKYTETSSFYLACARGKVWRNGVQQHQMVICLEDVKFQQYYNKYATFLIPKLSVSILILSEIVSLLFSTSFQVNSESLVPPMYPSILFPARYLVILTFQFLRIMRVFGRILVKHKKMNETFQAKQIHIIHMDSVKCEPYFTVNNNDLMGIMRKWTNI